MSIRRIRTRLAVWQASSLKCPSSVTGDNPVNKSWVKSPEPMTRRGIRAPARMTYLTAVVGSSEGSPPEGQTGILQHNFSHSQTTSISTEAWWCNFGDHFGHHFGDHFGDRLWSDRRTDRRSTNSDIISELVAYFGDHFGDDLRSDLRSDVRSDLRICTTKLPYTSDSLSRYLVKAIWIDSSSKSYLHYGIECHAVPSWSYSCHTVVCYTSSVSTMWWMKLNFS